jgi:hypothetical protein
VITDSTQVGDQGLGALPAALLETEQHLGDHELRQATQADLTALGDRWLDAAPMLFVGDAALLPELPWAWQ